MNDWDSTGEILRESEDQDDPEAPDAADIDDDDTAICTNCGKTVYDDSEICPHCGGYIHGGASRTTHAGWVILTTILCLIVIVVLWVGVR